MNDAKGDEALRRAYEASLKDAVADGGRLMKRVINKSLTSMPESAWLLPDMGQRNALAEAIRLLMKHQQFFCDAMPQALMEEFEKAAADIVPDDQYQEGALDEALSVPLERSITYDALELVSDEQMETEIDLLRANQAITAKLDVELAELNALMTAAQGLVRVRPDRNPLRPEVYMRAIRRVVNRVGTGPDVRRHWLRHFADALGPELHATYARVSGMLRSRGVTPADFQVITQDTPVRETPDLARANADLAASLQAMGFQAVTDTGVKGVDPASLLAAAEAAGMVVTGPRGRPVIAPAFFANPAWASPPGSVSPLGQSLMAPGLPSMPMGTMGAMGAMGGGGAMGGMGAMSPAAASVPLAPGLGGPELVAAGASPDQSRAKVTQTLRTVERIRRIMAGDDPGTGFEDITLEGQPESPLDAPEFAPTVPAAFEALVDMRQVDKVMQRLREGPRDDEPSETSGAAALRHSLRRQLDNPSQSLALEVVAVMVENLASDPRLLPPVQEAVRALESCLLRLALADSRFFSDAQHPARALLDQIAQRSLAWNSVEGAGFDDFIGPVQDTIRHLNEASVEDAKPFETALRHLQDLWGSAAKRDHERRRAAVRALVMAERRNVLAEKVATQFQARDDFRRAPREVTQFLIGPWAQIVAQALITLGEHEADPNGYVTVVGDLLWSADIEQVSQNPMRLTRVVPRMIATLKEGLASIEYESEQVSQFIEYMAALHDQVLRGNDQAQAATTVSGTPASSVDASAAQIAAIEASDAVPAAVPETWLAPAEAEAAGFLVGDRSAGPPSAAEAALHVLASMPFEDSQPDGQLPILGLETGAWVELFANEEWTRWQLTWASPHGTLFMFTDATGDARSMTKRLLLNMVAGGRLRMVAARAANDVALEDEFSLGPLI